MDKSLQTGAAGAIEMSSTNKTALNKKGQLNRGSSLRKVALDARSLVRLVTFSSESAAGRLTAHGVTTKTETKLMTP